MCLVLLQADEGGRRAPHPHGLLYQPVFRVQLCDGSSQRVALRDGCLLLRSLPHLCGIFGRLVVQLFPFSDEQLFQDGLQMLVKIAGSCDH